MKTVGISLGFNCDSATYGVNHNYRITKEMGYKTCPFDLMITNYQGIIDCINDDFKFFIDLNYIEIIKSTSKTIFITNNTQDNLIYNNKYKFIFNHESPGHANLYLTEKWKNGIQHYTNNNYEKFIEKYDNRINNFRYYINNGYFINFILTRYNTEKISDIPLLHYTISKKYPLLKFNFIFNNYKDNLWILEHFILLKIEETTDEYQRLVK